MSGYRYTDVPTLVRVKYFMMGKVPAPSAVQVEEEKKLEKERKDKEKSTQQSADRQPPIVESPDAGQFGDYRIIQSRYRTNRNLLPVSALDESLAGQQVWVRARVHTVRAKGKSCFMKLRRGMFSVQAAMFAGENNIPTEMVKYAGKIPSESIVEVYATVSRVNNPTNTTQSRVELQVQKLFVVSAASALPFQLDDAARPDVSSLDEEKKEADVIRVNQQTRLDNRCIDLRTPANHAIFRLQSQVTQFFRNFFLERDFVEVHTPKITPGVSEGGASVFRLGYFGTEACLAQSPQLYKQMSSACSDLFRVFEIGPVFRAENSNTHRHLCEFVGLDFEMEIREHYREVVETLGDLFVYIFDQINERCKHELGAVNDQYAFTPLKYRRQTLILDFREAVKMLREAGENMGDYDDFTTPQEKKLGELVKQKYDTEFYVVDRYPLAARPFYTMPCPDDPMYTNSYDVFLRGEEITSGAQRIHEVPLLLKRAAECGIPPSNIQAYVESFKYGVPPHGGAGIGLERVVMLFLALPNIRMSSMFPRDPKRLNP